MFYSRHVSFHSLTSFLSLLLSPGGHRDRRPNETWYIHDMTFWAVFQKKSRCYWITAAEKYSQLTFLAGKQETAISGAHSSPLLYSGDCLRLYDNANLTRWLLLSAPSQKNVVLSASLNLYIEYWKSVMEATHNSVPTEPATICGALPFTSGYSESISELDSLIAPWSSDTSTNICRYKHTDTSTASISVVASVENKKTLSAAHRKTLPVHCWKHILRIISDRMRVCVCAFVFLFWYMHCQGLLSCPLFSWYKHSVVWTSLLSTLYVIILRSPSFTQGSRVCLSRL